MWLNRPRYDRPIHRYVWPKSNSLFLFGGFPPLAESVRSSDEAALLYTLRGSHARSFFFSIGDRLFTFLAYFRFPFSAYRINYVSIDLILPIRKRRLIIDRRGAPVTKSPNFLRRYCAYPTSRAGESQTAWPNKIPILLNWPNAPPKESKAIDIRAEYET